MQQEKVAAMDTQLDRLSGPMQRLTALTLNSMERLGDFQAEAMQHYTHFALQQWRDLLEIHDENSLRDYFDKRQQAAEVLGRRISQDAQELTRINQELAHQAQKITLQNMRSLTEAARTTTAQAQQRMERSGERASGAEEDVARRVR